MQSGHATPEALFLLLTISLPLAGWYTCYDAPAMLTY